MASPARLHKLIGQLAKGRVLVVGDLILDKFVWGNVDRISPEAPVPVVWVETESCMPGGASNVANNIASLGGRAYLCGVIGKDEEGGALAGELRKRGIDIEGVLIDPERPTTVKTRVIAHHQQVCRIDKERVDRLPRGRIRQLIEFARRKVGEVDAVIIEDYGKGVVVPELIQALVKTARQRRRVVLVDPKEEHFPSYVGVTAITPNQTEASAASGVKITDEASLKRAGEALLKRLKCEAVLITRGEHGMSLFEQEGRVTHIPTVAQEVFDVSGAGDTVIATFALAKAAGASVVDAAVLSNFAAGIVVGKVGIAAVTPEELRERITNHA